MDVFTKSKDSQNFANYDYDMVGVLFHIYNNTLITLSLYMKKGETNYSI